jgi:hypothetical protein
MDQNRRETQRFSVLLYMERREPIEAPLHIHNLSENGFLVHGDILAGQGGIFHAIFRVHPSSGEMRVTTRGRVMHSRMDGPNSEFGIKIDDFGSPEEEKAYQAYVRELAERASGRTALVQL